MSSKTKTTKKKKSKKPKKPLPQPGIGPMLMPLSFLILVCGLCFAMLWNRNPSGSSHEKPRNLHPAYRPTLVYDNLDFEYKPYFCPYPKHSTEFFINCGKYFSFSDNYYHSRDRFRNLSKINNLPTIYQYIDKSHDLTMDFTLISGKNCCN